ncbi:MAG TPA: hypothetical protein VJ689_08560 [Gaiellaceae bacterium]|nr:hypothetical protein [Gaiellaceae bacterium]
MLTLPASARGAGWNRGCADVARTAGTLGAHARKDAPLRQLLAIASPAALAALALAAGTATAAGPAFSYDPALAATVRNGLRAATYEAESAVVKNVYVKCYRDRAAFERPLFLRFGVERDEAPFLTAYYAGGGEVHLRAGSCANARLFADGVVRWDTAAAMSVLLHESLHRQGVRDERATTCLANDAVRWAAKGIGLSDAQADRARLLAFRYTAQHVPPRYRMSRFACLRLIVQDEVTWWAVVRRPRLERRFGETR